MAALSNYFNLEEITTARKVNAAVINISGRQRMLSQRSAFFLHEVSWLSECGRKSKTAG